VLVLEGCSFILLVLIIVIICALTYCIVCSFVPFSPKWRYKNHSTSNARARLLSFASKDQGHGLIVEGAELGRASIMARHPVDSHDGPHRSSGYC